MSFSIGTGLRWLLYMLSLNILHESLGWNEKISVMIVLVGVLLLVEDFMEKLWVLLLRCSILDKELLIEQPSLELFF